MLTALYAVTMRIGIDIGNVIIAGGGTDTQFFTDDYMKTPEMRGAFESINYLKQEGHVLHIVSKCGPVVEKKSMEWLNEHGFFWIFPPQNIHFVRKRDLKVFMALALELDIFIDDMEDVILSMENHISFPILHTSWRQTNIELERIMNEQA